MVLQQLDTHRQNEVGPSSSQNTQNLIQKGSNNKNEN
jgi:hypothetical protein